MIGGGPGGRAVIQTARGAMRRLYYNWLATNGGMALVNTHPHYMNFGRTRRTWEEYPAHLYEEFLEYAKRRFGDVCWTALPREVAAFCRATRKRAADTPGALEKGR